MNASTQLVESREITIEVIVSRVWRRKWLVVLLALACAAMAGVAALVFPKSYVATLVAAPAAGNSGGGALGGGLGAMASQFGGLASLAGITVPGDSRKYESLAVLQSEALTERYISSHNLLPILYADDWDASKGAWKTNDAEKTPTLWKANRNFKRIRNVSTDAKTGLITLSIKWSDPKLAASWANDLVALTNEYLRNKAIAEAEVNLAYLYAEAAKTDVVPVRQGIYTMIQGEINKAMMAKGTSEFSLKVLDPAVAPEKPSSPQLAIWVLAGFFCGTLFACLLAFVLESKAENLSQRLVTEK
jgi:uncharacterized protein involved in exopolysaccharide biosynthesis